MGRLRTKPRPSLSGAVIFYGVSGSSSQCKSREIQGATQIHESPEGGIADHQTVVPPPSTSPSPITNDASSITSSLDLNTDSSSYTSLSSLSIKLQENRLDAGVVTKSYTKPSGRLTRSDVSTVLGLAKDTIALFVHVPYVQVVATVIQRIIAIADNVQNNKDRSLELIDKVVLYAGVIFDALNNSDTRSGNDLDGLKSELLQIANILESIYEILETLSVSTITARINRVFLRDEISGQLAEQDRRLDTVITSFQLKSSIVLRRAIHVEATQQSVAAQRSKPDAQSSRPIVRLRSRPQIMFGRDKEIGDMVDVILQQPPARLAILGPGGIGKTSLALAVLHDKRIAAKFDKNRLFISCEAATSVDHIIGDLALSLQITGDRCSGQLFDAVLALLHQSTFLVVFDNLETPWEVSSARADVEQFLQELADLKSVTMLVTIRGSQHPPGVSWSELLPPLKPVDLESALKIFTAISHKRDEYAEKLVQAVDRVPLAVTLLGNLAAVDGETTEALWHRWCEENVDMVESGDGRLNSLDCSIELSLSSPRIRRDPGALNLLSLLSLLPDGVTSETASFLEGGIPGILHTKRALATLRQNALLSADSCGSIRILSPIRLYMRARHPPSPDSRRFLQDYFLDLARHGVYHNDPVMKKRLSVESGNIEAMLTDSLDFPLDRPMEDVVGAVLAFCHHTYLFGLGSSGAVSLAAEKLICIPPSPSNLTPPVKRVTRPRRLLVFRFRKDAPKVLPVSDNKGPPVEKCANSTLRLRGDCFGCWGQLLSRQLRFEEAQNKFELAIQLHVEAGDTSGHAYDLHNLGCLLSRGASTFSRAQSCFKEALALHEQLGDQVGAAYDLMGFGQLLLQQAKFCEAETAFKKALQFFTECGDELGRASALNNLGHAVLSYSTPREADQYFLQALQINRTTGDVIGQADSLAGLACTLLLRSRFSEARQRIGEAIALRSPIENPDHLHILGRVFVAEYEFDQAVEMLSRAEGLHAQMDDAHGIAEDKRYRLQIDFFRGQLADPDLMRPDGWALRQRLSDLEDLHKEDQLGLADTQSTIGMIGHIIFYNNGTKHFKKALATHTELGSLLGQAFNHHQLECYYLRWGVFEEAKANLRKALELHERTENVQGQADDYNKLAELSLRQGLFQEALMRIACHALKLHTQIGDIAGQADDIYIQACVFLEQYRLEEAEDTIRRALELHWKAGFLYGQALDLATLSSIMWQRCTGQEATPSDRAAALETLDRAAVAFARCLAKREVSQCHLRYVEMLREDLSLKDIPTRVLTWEYPDSDDSDDEWDSY
ncbi:hypothetical protein LshimejAT787_1100530 [Lyophyllum shimeji]|uniref:Novel STAND NTPase 1 domain-containing protein n=1 Tax=Lyophyllum shimeji TaxID=47721 RepID=A0A9P3UQW2_LYOSH|nr:hypothetical protein LshimejAT787_1100530 [Lyophyllum shimeji]